MAKGKVGLAYENKNPIMVTRPDGAFVGCVDGVTFGVDENGNTFHTGGNKWTLVDQLRWAQCNSRFFCDVANKLAQFAKALADK